MPRWLDLAGQRLKQIPPRFIMVGAFANTSVINYAFGLVTGWLLLPGDFGLLAFAQTIILIAGLLLNSGVSTALAESLVHSDKSRHASLIRGAFLANLLIALLLSLVIELFFAVGLLQQGFETSGISWLVIGTFPLLSFVAVAKAAFQGTGRFAALAFMQVVEVLGKFAAGIAFILGGLQAAGAIAGFIVGALIATMTGLALLRQENSIFPWGRVEWLSWKAAGGMFGGLLGLALLLNMDILALKLLTPTNRAVTGQYQAGIILANTPYFLASALCPILFTQAAHLKKLNLTGPAVGEIMRLVALFLIPIEAVLLFEPARIMALFFPPAYLEGAATLSILALANSAVILVAVFTTVFQAVGRARIPAFILLVASMIEALAHLVIVPRWGAAGAASVFLAIALVDMLLLGGIYLNILKDFHPVSIIKWLLKFSLALGCSLFGALNATAFSNNVFIGLICGGCIYLGLCLGLKLINLELLPLPKRFKPGRLLEVKE